MKTIDSSALSVFSTSKTTAHRDWVERGFTGEGRIVVEDQNISELPGYFGGEELSKIRLVNCNLENSHIGSSYLKQADLIKCNWRNCDLDSVYFDRATIQNCTFYNTEFNWCKFVKAQINRGDWSSCNFSKPYFTGAKIREVNFSNSLMSRALLHKSRITDCSFQYTDLSSGIAYFAVWESCDFRGVNFENFQFKNTILKNCGFYNSGGIPQSLEGIQIINPDLSENFDGSNIVDQQTIIEQWQQPVPQFIREKYQQREVITAKKEQDKKDKINQEIDKRNEELTQLRQEVVTFYSEKLVKLYDKFIEKYNYLIDNNWVNREAEIAGDEDAAIQGREEIPEITEELVEMYNDLVDNEYIKAPEETTGTLYSFIQKRQFKLLIDVLNPETTERYADYEVGKQEDELSNFYNNLVDLYNWLCDLSDELAEEKGILQSVNSKELLQLEQEINSDQYKLTELRSQLKIVEERIIQARRTNIFNRPQSGENERDKERLTQEIQEVKDRIAQNELALKALEQ